MEINKYSDIRGVVTKQAMVEGRLVLIVAGDETYNFGSRTDLPGVRLPVDSTEAALARYVVAFAVDNRETPIYQDVPDFTYALRGGFSQSENVPFSATVHLTPPGNKIGQTIPSGIPALAFGGGVFTIPSGSWIYNASATVPGASIVAANTADDSAAEAGMPKYSASATSITVERYNSTTGDLTIRTLVP